MLCLAVMCAAAGQVQAAVVTFQFVYPNWNVNGIPGLFGTNPIVTMTLDNGSNNLNQVYNLETDLLNLHVQASGGTFTNSWTGSQIYLTSSGPFNYVSTDGSGTPKLSLTEIADSRIVYSNSGGTFQFGTGSFTQSWLTAGPGFDPPGQAFHNTTFDRLGTIIPASPAVPEPTSIAIYGIGALGMGLVARRRKKRSAII
jgi:hypothetical protein